MIAVAISDPGTTMTSSSGPSAWPGPPAMLVRAPPLTRTYVVGEVTT